jgi:multidrug efflux pump
VEQLQDSVDQVLAAGWKSGKFLYVDSDLKVDLPEARVVIDRERVADLGLDLAGVGRELGTLLGGAYVNRFNYFDRSYKVIPQIGDAERATIGPLLDLKIKTPRGELVPVSSFTHVETEAAPRTLQRFQQRNAVRIFGGVKPGVTKEEGLRVLETAAGGIQGRGIILDHAGESRQIRREGGALTTTLGFAVILIYLVLAAQFQSFRDPLIVLLGSVPLAISGALVFSFLNLTTINIYSQVGLITLVGLIAKNGILIVQFANKLQEEGAARLAAIREAVPHPSPPCAHDLGGDGVRAPAAGLRDRSRVAGAEQHRDRPGHRDDGGDDLHALRGAGVLPAHRRRASEGGGGRGRAVRRPGDREMSSGNPVPRTASGHPVSHASGVLRRESTRE